VSEELVKHLNTADTCIGNGDYETLEILFGWILRRQIQSRTQLSLVRAWRFGALYSMALFQNDVMRSWVDVLHSNPVDPYAVREAYYDIFSFFIPSRKD